MSYQKGKWYWEVNLVSKSVSLRTNSGGWGNIVMDFVRWGMQSAQPRFNVNGLLVDSRELMVPEKGREHHAHWHLLLKHPDARLITAAPDLLELLKNESQWDNEVSECCSIINLCDNHAKKQQELKAKRSDLICEASGIDRNRVVAV